MAKIPDHIVAVGYEVDFENLRDIIEKEVPDKVNTWRVLSGVWYSPSCRNVSDSIKTPKELGEWFKSRRNNIANEKDEININYDERAFVSKLYVSKNHRLIVGEVYRGTDSFYVFFYNENNVPTSLIKKEINRGDDMYRSISFERITLFAKPYIHRMVNGKNVITY